MKVIDLLQRIANKKDIPKVVKILDNTLLPDFRILKWNKDLELYEYIDKTEFNCVLDKYHLNLEVEIIEDTPIEDKKIEKLKSVKDNSSNATLIDVNGLEYYMTIPEATILDKVNEIIDKINGDSNE